MSGMDDSKFQRLEGLSTSGRRSESPESVQEHRKNAKRLTWLYTHDPTQISRDSSKERMSPELALLINPKDVEASLALLRRDYIPPAPDEHHEPFDSGPASNSQEVPSSSDRIPSSRQGSSSQAEASSSSQHDSTVEKHDRSYSSDEDQRPSKKARGESDQDWTLDKYIGRIGTIEQVQNITRSDMSNVTGSIKDDDVKCQLMDLSDMLETRTRTSDIINSEKFVSQWDIKANKAKGDLKLAMHAIIRKANARLLKPLEF